MRATMSKVSALRECQWWARPDAKWVHTPAGPAAEFGTAVHAHVAGHVLKGLSLVADGSHVDHAVVSSARSVVEWWASIRDTHETWHAEPAYVLDVDRAHARHIGNNLGRAYPRVGPFEMAGSADIVGISPGLASVYDVKTGRPENVEPAADNAQLRTLALAVHLAHRVNRVRVGLVFPGAAVEEHEYDALDLAAWQAELADLVDKVPTAQPKPSKSACRYCPAKPHCPAMVTALAEVTPQRRLPIVMDAAEIQGPEHAREQYLALRALKTGIDEAWAALRRYAEEHGPVALGDGKVYGSRQTTRESIDLSSRAAVDTLRAELGEAFAFAVELSTSKTAIKGAAREVATATGEKAAAVERRVLEALRAAGAVKVSTSTTWDEMNEGA